VTSLIYTGHVVHARLEPVEHRFTYPLHVFAIDLDDLPLLRGATRLFGYNRVRLAAIHDRDYLPGPGRVIVRGRNRAEPAMTTGLAIREKLMAYLGESGEGTKSISRIILVTAARILNYAFNPVSFYYCFHPNGTLQVAVAEVNNTFGETHLYVLRDSLEPAPGFLARYIAPKQFHVSPFNDMGGEYEFHLSDIRDKLDIRVNILREGRVVFRTLLFGRAHPFGGAQLAGTLARYPLSAMLTVPRIMWQAARLHFGRKLPAHPKPNPSSPMTIGIARPGWLQRIALRLVSSHLAHVRAGTLHVRLPDGSVDSYGGFAPGRDAEIRVLNYRFFQKVMLRADVGFGDAYVDGDWETDDLPGVISFFIENRDLLDDRNIRSAWAGRIADRLAHLLNANTPAGSRRNISCHYDLPDGLYRQFLDENMVYSCAVFDHNEDTLEQAQMNKIRRMIAKLQVGPDHQVLEIGSGWGTFAIEVARLCGCRVKAMTLSQKQLEATRQRVKVAGLEDRVEVCLCDYRHVEGHFDRIVSIEMLEAVGHRHLGTFFRTCDRTLKPGGLVALQVITIPDQRYDAYRKGCDWIQKHIFPGGMLPSLAALGAAMHDHSALKIEEVENIGVHYAPTLREWARRFNANWPRISSLGFDERFRRMWNYYLAYCEAAFSTHTLGVLQMVLRRPGNPTFPGSPGHPENGQEQDAK
jgi:cyclopropane-fatty-acyl-phospholipid synthase